jgi:hypothetical protein
MTRVPLDSPKGKELAAKLIQTLREAMKEKAVKVSKAATRAAAVICDGDDYCCRGQGTSRKSMAVIIDQETGLPELLAALRCFVDDERFAVSVGGNPNVVPAMIAAGRAAIAKASR